MTMQALTIELVRLAHAATTSPESRMAMASALRSALAVVEPGRTLGADVALTNLSEHLTSAAEHVDFLREVITQPRP